MRLNSSQIIAKRSPTKGGWKMGKAKSMLENIQLRDYGQRSAKSEFVESQNWIFQKSQDIGGIQNFVEEVSSDPSILLNLVDYKQLIMNLEQENNSLKQNIQNMKSQIQKLYSMNQNYKQVEQDSPINLINKQQNSIKLKINKYMELIAVEKSNFMARKQHRKQEAKKLARMIFQIEKDAKIKREQLNALFTREMEHKILINGKCKQIEKNIQILKSKFSLLGLDAKKNELIREKVEQLRKKVLNLKNQQIQEISNYKKLISNSKTNQLQFKKSTEKKISKFINQLTKILESSDNEALQNLIQKNSSNKDEIRNKNSSSDTKPDENEEDELKNEKQETLKSLKQRIPSLSVYDSLAVKGLDEQNLSKPRKNMERDQQKMLEYQRDINNAEEKIKNLSQQEIDVNSFLQALQQKIMKINSQLNGNGKDIHIYINK